VQIATHADAHVTAVVGRADRGVGLREMGAAEIVEGIENAKGRYRLNLESAADRPYPPP
jgi:hypothetical protein